MYEDVLLEGDEIVEPGVGEVETEEEEATEDDITPELTSDLTPAEEEM